MPTKPARKPTLSIRDRLRSLRTRSAPAADGFRAGIDAVIVNYRTPGDLEASVAAMAAAEPRLDIALTIANVSPTAEDVAAAERCLGLARDGLTIRHLPFADNVGYATSCNTGLVGGGHDVIALFNADTQATPGTLSQCRDGLLANRTWGALGPRQVDQHGRITAGGTFGTNVKPQIRGFRQPDTGQFSDVRDDAVTVAGSAYFMRRAVWQELTECPTYQSSAPGAEGAFLPTRLFYEETFCSYHAAQHDYRNVFFGSASMIHTWHGSIDATGAPAGDLFEESRTFFRRACDDHGIDHD